MMRFNQCGEDENSLRQHIQEHKALLERLPDGNRLSKGPEAEEFWRKQYIRDLIETRTKTLERLLAL